MKQIAALLLILAVLAGTHALAQSGRMGVSFVSVCELGPFGTVPPLRQPVDTRTKAFQALDLLHVYVLDIDENLWLEQAPFGSVPPVRVQVDGNVR